MPKCMVILRDFTVGLVFFDELFRKSLEIASTKSGKEADYLPSRKLTYPTWGKGKSSSKWTFQGKNVGSQEGILVCTRNSSWHLAFDLKQP